MNKTEIIQKTNRAFPYLIIGILALLIYGNTLKLDYALDDTLVITGNEYTKKGIDGIYDILTNDAFTGFFGQQKNLVAGGRYRPLSQIMFAIEYELFGFNPFIGHLLNILLYGMLGMLLFHMLRKLFREKDRLWWFSISLIASLLFIAHPLHTEAVANIKGRDEILSTLFSILAWTFAIRYIDRRSWFALICVGISLFLGLMSKENSITFVAVIPLSLYFFRKDAGLSRIAFTLVPLLLSSVLFLVVRHNAVGSVLGGGAATEILNNPYINSSTAEQIATNLLTWGKYYLLLIFPHPLTHDYYPHFYAITGFGDVGVLAALITTIGLVVTSFLLFKKKRYVSFGILYFFITFSIMSNVVFNIGTLMNERFMFIPLLGFTIIVAWLLFTWKVKSPGSPIPTVILIVLLLAYSGKTISRNTAWADDYTLFTTDVEVSENSIKCNVSAGGKTLEKYENTKDPAEKKRLLAQAIPWLEKGVALHKTYLAGWEQLGKAYYFRKDVDRAWVCYQNCLSIKPGSETAKKNLGLVAELALSEKEYDKAIEYLSRMKEISPNNAQYSTGLSEAYLGKGEAGNALKEIEDALLSMPDNDKLLAKAGEIWGRYLNRLDRSEEYLEQAIQINPENASALENLGIVYGMTGRLDTSLELLMRALALEPENTRVMTNIGNTLSNMGRKEDAQEYFSRANSMSKE